MTERLFPYSSGFHGRVSAIASPVFANADFLKEELDASSLHYKLVYYSHLITNALFPGTVIHIVGANTQEDLSMHRLYSNDARVCPDHAVYTQHMTLVENGKANICGCAACSGHRMAHLEGIDLDAQRKAAKLLEYGICLPWNDPSDYCISDDGHLIFFEIDGFRPDVLRNSLRANGHEVARKDSALRLLDRYEQLARQDVCYCLD